MEKIKKICNYYRYDIAAILVLLAVFAYLVPIFIFRVPNPLIDCFETGVYVPWLILKGKVLYKDMYIFYGPLSCQINALFLLLFGQKISSIFIAGIVNSLLLTATLYLIARTIASELTAFVTAFLITITCVFHYCTFNFIFPYAPAASYGLSSLLLAMLFSIYYIKTSNPKLMVLSSLFAGICLLIKLDFIFSAGALILISLFLKPLSRKYLLISLGAFIFLPVISWSVLFIQGLRIHDIISFLHYYNNFINLPSVKQFYTHNARPLPSIDTLSCDLTWFIITAMYFLPVAVIYPVLGFFKNKRIFQLICTGILISGLVYFHRNFEIHCINFCWIGVSTALILFILTIKSFLKPKQISLRTKILIIIAISGTLAALRSFFLINLQLLGTYLFPLLLLVNMVFLMEYLPDYLKFLNKHIWRWSCAVILIVLGISTAINHINMVNNTYPVKSKAGTIYVNSDFAEPLNQTVQYIEKNFPPDARFVVMPKGVALNFMTQRLSDNWCFDLIPPVVEAYGEDNMIDSLRKNPPEYILINNKSSKAAWARSLFGGDYGHKLYGFVLKNYKLEKKFSSKTFWIAIYKKMPYKS